MGMGSTHLNPKKEYYKISMILKIIVIILCGCIINCNLKTGHSNVTANCSIS